MSDVKYRLTVRVWKVAVCWSWQPPADSAAADLSEADESQILSPFFLDIEESDEENWWW